MVLGKLPVLGILQIWITERQGPTVLAVGASGIVWTCLAQLIKGGAHPSPFAALSFPNLK